MNKIIETNFMDSIIGKKKEGDFISINEIETEYYKKYNVIINEESIDYWNINVNDFRKLIKVKDGYLVYPIRKDIDKLYAKIFFQDINNHRETSVIPLLDFIEEFEKEFKLDFYKSDLDSWVNKISKKLEDEYFIPIKEKQYIIISYASITDYTKSLFEKKPYLISFQELQKQISKHYSYEFDSTNIDYFINTNEPIIKKLGSYLISSSKMNLFLLEQMVTLKTSVEETIKEVNTKFDIKVEDKQISSFKDFIELMIIKLSRELKSLFDKKEIGSCISIEELKENEQKVTIPDYILEESIRRVNQNLEEIQLIKQNEYIVSTMEKSNAVAKISHELRCLFLSNEVGFSISDEDLRIFCKRVLNISKSNSSLEKILVDVCYEGINNANDLLRDIKIIRNNNSFYSILCIGDNCSRCSVLERFDEEFKKHILSEHISDKDYCSIIQKKGNKFYCRNCKNDNLIFVYGIDSKRIIGHIRGDCKKASFWNKQDVIEDNYIQNDYTKNKKTLSANNIIPKSITEFNNTNKVEDIIAKVIAKYDSDVLYNILENVSLYKDDSLVDININDIEFLLENENEISEEKYQIIKSYAGLKQKGDISNYLWIKNTNNTEIIKGLKYIKQLYTKKSEHYEVPNDKKAFIKWLQEVDRKSYITAKNYATQLSSVLYLYASLEHNFNLIFPSQKNVIALVNQIVYDFSRYGKYSQIGRDLQSIKKTALKKYARFITYKHYSSILFDFYPKDKEQFSLLFSQIGIAKVTFYYDASYNNTVSEKIWRDYEYRRNVDIKNYVLNHPFFTNALEDPIVRIKIEIDMNNLI